MERIIRDLTILMPEVKSTLKSYFYMLSAVVSPLIILMIMDVPTLIDLYIPLFTMAGIFTFFYPLVFLFKYLWIWRPQIEDIYRQSELNDRYPFFMNRFTKQE